MRIACLQFAPQVGDVNNNLNRADAVLSKANPQDLDLLVLPELAFSGYNFRSLQEISPYLEPTTAGITSLWARTTALKYNCHVTAGYPEKVDVAPKWPAGPEYYNSAITVNAEGETVANYRKSFLYYTDETWALEGPGFFAGKFEGLGDIAMGICMDLNPYKFESPWNAWEFAHHCLHAQVNLVIISMAWLTREDPRAYSQVPREPDMETLSYWLARLEPLIRAEKEGEIIVVFANRCGSEDEATYAGTSAVLGINAGEVKVYGILGRGEKELLIVDTDKRPQAKLVSEPNTSVSVAAANQSEHTDTESRSNVPPMLGTDHHDSAMDDDDDDFYEDDFDLEEHQQDDAHGFLPVSPTDPRFPQAYFGPKQSTYRGDNPRNSLISSIGRTDSPSPSPCPFQELENPPSNKENATSQREEKTTEPPTILVSNVGKEPIIGQFQPQSASGIDGEDSSFTHNELGPRSSHVSLRPRSTVW